MTSPLKIALVQPPFEDFYATPIRHYPLGLLYAARTLRTLGCDVRVLDCLSPLKKKEIPVPERFSYLRPWLDRPGFFRGYYRFGLADGLILSRIREIGPDWVGISSLFTAYFSSVAKLAGLIKDRLGLPVFIGGHHPTVFPEESLRRAPAIDRALQGPAETCLPLFLSGLKPEIAFSSPDWRELRPAHDLVDAGAYRIGRRRSMALAASRGCPHHCDFCGVQVLFGRRMAYRSVDGVLAEMHEAALKRGVRVFNFEDDNLSHDREWFMAFLAAVSGEAMFRDAELTAMNGLCASNLDAEVLAAMRRAGFKRLNLSLVTQDVKLRDFFHRPHQSEEFKGLVRKAQSLGFQVTVYIILGLPGQTPEEVRDSVDGLLDLGALVGPSVYYPAPGSRLYDELHVPRKVKDDWDSHRSSAFAVETEHFTRAELVELFLYVRQENLKRKRASPHLPNGA
jgi:anaerobic magnesium-protoporphyrin IX monomethyl ester cyclase